MSKIRELETKYERNSISEWMRNNRDRLSLLQRDLAEGLNVSHQIISEWEVGKTLPPASRIQQMAEFFALKAQEQRLNNLVSGLKQWELYSPVFTRKESQ